MTHNILTSRFNTHNACIKYLERIKWNGKPTCSYCKSKNASKKRNTHRYTCLDCRNSYSVTVNTLFESSKVPLNKWFYAIYLITHARKGISAAQLAETLNIAYNSASYLRRKIQAGMTAIINAFQNVLVPRSYHNKEESLRSRKYKAKELKEVNYKKFTHLKKLFGRSVFGTFHQLSEFYAQYYFNELVFIYKNYKRSRYRSKISQELIKRCTTMKIAFM